MDLNQQDFWAGLADCILVPERFELGEGVTISQTYAHFMAPFLMAFTPATPGKPHPAPWKPAKGGFDIDITAELFIPATCHLEHLDRLNAAWWIVALLRLKATAVVYTPVVSSQRFSAIPVIQEEPELWPVEIHTHRLVPEIIPHRPIELFELEWLKTHWLEASALLGNEDFSLAFQAFDQSIWGSRPALALVEVWGALERLFCPSTQELSFRVSANLAAFLENSGRERYRCFKHIRGLYNDRSRAAHGEGNRDMTPYLEIFAIARRALLKIVETRHVPEKRELEAALLGDEIGMSDENRTIQ
jgi:hypothetical protein